MKLGNSSRAMGVGVYFLKVFWGGLGGCRKLLRAGERVRAARSQVVIFSVCYEWRICSV